MENKAHALTAGIFVLAVSILLVALAFWLQRDSAQLHTYEVATRQAITGLQPQASVQFRGVRVGKVSEIAFDPQVPGQIILRLAVAESTPVTRSTFASLGFQGVTGIAFVQLDDDGASAELLPENERLTMRPGLVGQLSERGAHAMAELEQAGQRLNLLLAPQNQQLLLDSVQAIGQAARGLPPLLQRAGESLAALSEAGRVLTGAAQNAGQAATEYGQLAQRLQQTGGLLDQISRSAAALTTSSQSLQADTLPRLHHSIEQAGQAARQLGQAATALQANPQALLFGPTPVAPGPGEPGFSIQGGRP